MAICLSKFNSSELLALYGNVIEELRRREVVRSTNNPVADYSELLFCRAFGWIREGNSKKGYDAICNAGIRYQIKGRRPTPQNKSTQLSALRSLDSRPFDMLAGILYNPDFTVARAAIIPYDTVFKLAKYKKDWGWCFHLHPDLWDIPQVLDVTAVLGTVRI